MGKLGPTESGGAAGTKAASDAGARLAGRRVLVVGASSGIGRALVEAAVAEGARVAIAARRRELLEELVAGLGEQVVSVPCDVRQPEACEAVVRESVEALGGLDALVYATGVAVLTSVREAGPEHWQQSLEINLVGASLVTRAALPHLEASGGRAVYLSSIAADDAPPRPGLGLYVVAKTALNRLIDVWREEHHAVSFTGVSVGDTGDTGMAAGWDPADLQRYLGEWQERGYLFGRMMQPESVAQHLVDVLASEETIGATRIVPRREKA